MELNYHRQQQQLTLYSGKDHQRSFPNPRRILSWFGIVCDTRSRSNMTYPIPCRSGQPSVRFLSPVTTLRKQRQQATDAHNWSRIDDVGIKSTTPAGTFVTSNHARGFPGLLSAVYNLYSNTMHTAVVL